MNPEENKLDGSITTPLSTDTNSVPLEQSLSPNPDSSAASSPEIQPESTPEESAPSLDQVAADLASAAMSNNLENAGATELSATSGDTTIAPETPTSPEAPIAPEAPTSPVAPNPVEDSNVSELSTATESPVVAEESTTPEPPSTSNSSEQGVTPPSSPLDLSGDLETDSLGATNDFTNDGIPAEGDSNSDSSDENEDDSDKKEEEIPLHPADPVPGSIGSAFAYSETAPDHSIPVPKPKKAPKVKKEKEPTVDPSDPTATSTPKKALNKVRVILIAVLGVVLVGVVGVIIFFIANNSSDTTTTKKADTSSNTPTTPVVSSLTCTREGVKNFQQYGAVTSGAEQAIAMYSGDTLTSFGTMLSLKYASEDSASDGLSLAKELYNTQLENANLSADPFDSSFDSSASNVIITHQAEGSAITTKNARILGLSVANGTVATDIETISNNYESNGFTCEEK